MKVLFIWGPHNTGKMSISKEIAKISNYRPIYAHNLMQMHSTLFHLVYGRFLQVEMEVYFQILDELLASDIPGIILTKVRYLNRKRDNKLVESILNIIRSKGVPIQEVELYTDIDVRLERKLNDLRLQGKLPKRKITIAEKRWKKWYNSDLQVNSSYPFGQVREDYVKIDTSHQTVSEITHQIMDGFHIKSLAHQNIESIKRDSSP